MYVLGDGKENKDIITEKMVCRVKIGFLKIFREEIIYEYKRYFVNIYHIHSIELVQSQKSMLMSFSFPQNNVFLFHSGFWHQACLKVRIPIYLNHQNFQEKDVQVYLEDIFKHFFFPECDVRYNIIKVLVVQLVKNLPAMQETQVWPLDQKDLLEKWMATHSLQYSFLENTMDRGGWQVTVHRVAQSQTQLSE